MPIYRIVVGSAIATVETQVISARVIHRGSPDRLDPAPREILCDSSSCNKAKIRVMSARKSIAKVQLGSVTPDKATLQGKPANAEEGVSLPSINGHKHEHAAADLEVRSAEKVPSVKLNGTARPIRGTILQKPAGSSSGKAPIDNAETNLRISRPSVIQQRPHDGGVDDSQQSLRISRPSIMSKQQANHGNGALTDQMGALSKAEETAIHSMVAPIAPAQPKSSGRSHRGTVLKHLPKAQSTEGSSLLLSAVLMLSFVTVF